MKMLMNIHYTTIALSCSILCSSVMAADADQQQRYKTYSERHKDEMIEAVQSDLNYAGFHLRHIKSKMGSYAKLSNKERNQAIKDITEEINGIKARLAKFKAGAIPIPLLYWNKLAVGRFGTWGNAGNWTLSSGNGPKHIVKIIDENQFLAKGLRDKPCVYKGIPTKGLVEGKTVDLTGMVFEVTGTQAYDFSLNDSADLFVLELMDPQPKEE